MPAGRGGAPRPGRPTPPPRPPGPVAPCQPPRADRARHAWGAGYVATHRGPGRPTGEGSDGAAEFGGQAAGAALTAEMSKVSFTLSLTMTPPVSRAAFQVRPQSERRMVALPSKPTRSAP